jgi:hypothetical protein
VSGLCGDVEPQARDHPMSSHRLDTTFWEIAKQSVDELKKVAQFIVEKKQGRFGS